MNLRDFFQGLKAICYDSRIIRSLFFDQSLKKFANIGIIFNNKDRGATWNLCSGWNNLPRHDLLLPVCNGCVKRLLAILYCNVTDVKTNRLRIRDVRCENCVKVLLVPWSWDRLLDFQVDTPLYESPVLGKQNHAGSYRSGDDISLLTKKRR